MKICALSITKSEYDCVCVDYRDGAKLVLTSYMLS